MSVCVPLASKCSKDILLSGKGRKTFKTIILKYYGVSKKWKKAQQVVWATIATIVSTENVCVCPPSTKMLYRHIVKGLWKNKFQNNYFKILRVSKKLEEEKQKWDLVSIKNACLCPHHTQMLYGHIVRGCKTITFFKYYGMSKKWKKGQNRGLGHYCHHSFQRKSLFVSPKHQNALQTYF